jgi:hypothetical protein
VFADILETLKFWRFGKGLVAAPQQIERLEERIAALEKEVSKRPAPEICPICFVRLRVARVEKHSYGQTEFHYLVCDTPDCRMIERCARYDPGKPVSRAGE